MVGKYNSMEPLIEKTKEDVLLAAYREFEARVVTVLDSKIAKEERIPKFTEEKVRLFTKSDIYSSAQILPLP